MRRRISRVPLRAALAGALVLLASCDRDPTSPSLRSPDAGLRPDVGAAAFNGNIRIGVVPAASSVDIGSEAGYTITDRASGAVLMTGTGGSATVTLESVVYSSTSGGHTADNEEAYNSAPVAYLRGIPDAEQGDAVEHVPTLEVFRAYANPTSLRAAKEGDFDSDWGRFHRWTFQWTMDEISQVISAYAGQPVGKVLAINVVERGPSGRVLRIEYITEAGTFVDTKDRIRWSLKYINAAGTPSALLSTLFFIEPVVDHASGATVGFRTYGGGYGHGVGLSQTGAVGMAERGHTYEQILKHYYRDIDLVRWY